MVFIYLAGACLVGTQFIFADVFHITMTNLQGQPLKNNLITDLHMNTINNVSNQIAQTNQTGFTANTIGVTANLMWDLVLLVTGFYIFDVMTQFGVPGIFIVIYIIPYIFLLIRSVAGWVRGI